MSNLGNYSEALEQQMGLLHWLQSPEGHRYRGEVLRPGAGEWRFPVIEVHSTAETFWISAQMVALLNIAADAVPEAALHIDLLPADRGFCWFAKPLPVPAFAREDEDEAQPTTLHGFTWGLGRRPEDAGIPGLFLVAWVTFDGHVILPWPLCEWLFGETQADAGRREVSHVGVRAFLMWLFDRIYSFWNLTQQHVLTAHHQRAERHARKRLERAGWTREPLIRVVQLRRAEAEQSAKHGQAHPDWSCQWFVRGHWRQQACGPKRGERQPRWILPYVKGPDTKPLKPPRATVFAVVR